jgi:hypothetical protein
MKKIFFLYSVVLLVSCGYALQNKRSRLKENEQVEKIYILPIKNQTFKPGLEDILLLGLVKRLSLHDAVFIVDTKEKADAFLQVTIRVAEYIPVAGTTVGTLSPQAEAERLLVKTFVVATTYEAKLKCEFALRKPHEEKAFWTVSLERTKVFLGSNQVGILGTTSMILNESDFDRTLSEIATYIIDDARENMVSLF